MHSRLVRFLASTVEWVEIQLVGVPVADLLNVAAPWWSRSIELAMHGKEEAQEQTDLVMPYLAEAYPLAKLTAA